jgi:omega-hydroxy-beta-dihydromenaquinone-9 sulfotransferase
MSWWLNLVRHIGPGGFSGTTFGDWIRILRENRFDVDAPYWPRAAVITLGSLMNSVLRRAEEARYGAQIEATTVPPPLFVLGIWRNGTTYLLNLLSQDDRFAFPTMYEAVYPHTFLTTERSSAPVMQRFVPGTRPMDNMKYGVQEPQEDEFALAASGLSYAVGLWAFPRNADRYRQFLSLYGATSAEQERWLAAWDRFLRKLTLKNGRRLVLKSPPHTCRIKRLLTRFPDAQFIHIHRHPYAVYRSTLHAWQEVMPWWRLQRRDCDPERVIRDYRDVYDAFFDERHLIPKENFCEVAFEDLESDPLRELSRIYDSLRLPDFGCVESRLRGYVQALAGYSRNVLPELPPETRARLAREWSRSFCEWGYPT